MSVLTATGIITGLSADHPCSFAQVKQTGVIVNGFDSNRIYSILSGTATTLGIVAPSAAPTSSFSGVGLTGTYRYRLKWKDSVTGTMSVSSAEVTVSPSNQGVTIDKTALTAPPARVTHWILERTLDSGKVFFPVNLTAAAPNGTAIATGTYNDTLSDRLLRQNTALRNVGSVPDPYMHCFAHNNRMWLLGGCLHTVTVTMTNANTAVTSTAGFSTAWNNAYLIIPTDTGNTPYKISSVTNASNLVLSTVYAGTTGSKSAMIFMPRNKFAWSESGEPEHFGTTEVGGLGNELTIGAQGEVLVSGCGIGAQGVLLAMETGMYYLSYTDDPNPLKGDGRIVAIASRRGVCSKNALKYINNTVYGMDNLGIWSMQPNGIPIDISQPLKYDFQRSNFNSCSSDSWHIGYDQQKRWVYFYISEASDAYPKLAFIWDESREKWVTTKTHPLGVPCSTELRDTKNYLRHAFVHEISGTAGSYTWTDNIGKTAGCYPTTSPLSGTVASGTGTTSTVSGAAYYTTGEKLKGVAVTKQALSDGTQETRIISDNTATQLTVSSAWTATPVAGDLVFPGPINAVYRTGRLDLGNPHRKKEWVSILVPLKYKTASVPLSMKVYWDHHSAADTDRNTSFAEDGITITASSATVSADPTTSDIIYEFPLNRVMRYYGEFEFFSTVGGEPWEIWGPIKIRYNTDPSEPASNHA